MSIYRTVLREDGLNNRDLNYGDFRMEEAKWETGQFLMLYFLIF